MANVPIERKSGGNSWWVWLLVLALIAGAIWLFADGFNTEVEDPIALEEPMTPGMGSDLDSEMGSGLEGDATGPITDASMIMGTSDASTIAGRQVDLQNMRVTRVVSDRGFFIVPADGGDQQEIFVRLDEEPTTPGTNVEGRVNVNEGQIIALRGVVQQFNEQDATTLGVSEADVSAIQDDDLWVMAEEIDIAAGGTS